MIGVIVAASPAENLNFVLPMREVLEAPAGRGRVDSRIPYQLPVMPFGVNETMRFNIELPLGPGEFGRKLEQESNAHSDRLRAKLLAEHAERLFPRGDKSVRMMHSYYPGWMPRLIRYGDDGEWSPRETSGETEASLPHGGKVTAGLIANTALIRVTSLGAAVRDDKHVDAYGRTWQLRSWRLDAMDLKVVALLLPVPNGYVALVRFIPEGRAHDNSEELNELQADYSKKRKKILDGQQNEPQIDLFNVESDPQSDIEVEVVGSDDLTRNKRHGYGKCCGLEVIETN